MDSTRIYQNPKPRVMANVTRLKQGKNRVDIRNRSVSVPLICLEFQ